MYDLNDAELSLVSGGNGTTTTTPSCTTTGSTTTCTCPAGFKLSAGSDGEVAKISCIKVATS
jgi:hypothetical protein